MPKRVATYRPPWLPKRPPSEAARPNAHQRGYCSPAWRKTRLAVIARDLGVCQLCGCIVTEYAQVDHIRPKADGGTDALENLRLLCRPCHSKRTAMDSR